VSCIWCKKVRNKLNRGSIISHLTGKARRTSLLGERRGWRRKTIDMEKDSLDRERDGSQTHS
jgi:hypothetical protein